MCLPYLQSLNLVSKTYLMRLHIIFDPFIQKPKSKIRICTVLDVLLSETNQLSNQLQRDRLKYIKARETILFTISPPKGSISLVLIMMNGKSFILLIGFLALNSDAWILDLERAQRTIKEIDSEEASAKGKKVMVTWVVEFSKEG